MPCLGPRASLQGALDTEVSLRQIVWKSYPPPLSGWVTTSVGEDNVPGPTSRGPLSLSLHISCFQEPCGGRCPHTDAQCWYYCPSSCSSHLAPREPEAACNARAGQVPPPLQQPLPSSLSTSFLVESEAS